MSLFLQANQMALMVHRIFTVQHARLRSFKEIENSSGSMQSCFTFFYSKFSFNPDILTTPTLLTLPVYRETNILKIAYDICLQITNYTQ